MRNNNISKIAYISIILLLISFVPISMYATTKNELEDQRQELDKKIEETNTEIQGVKSQMSKKYSIFLQHPIC